MGVISRIFLRFRRRPKQPAVFSHKGIPLNPELRTRRGLEMRGSLVSTAEIRAEAELERHIAEGHRWPRVRRRTR